MQITHYVNKKYPARESTVGGDPQIVDLPFKCVEGNLEANWCLDADGMDSVSGKKFHHQQFSILMHLRLSQLKTTLRHIRTWVVLGLPLTLRNMMLKRVEII